MQQQYIQMINAIVEAATIEYPKRSFHLTKLLGSGGKGAAFLATSSNWGNNPQQVVIKLQENMKQNEKDFILKLIEYQNIYENGNNQQYLPSNIIRMYEYFQWKSKHCIIMEIGAENLFEYLSKITDLSIQQKENICFQITQPIRFLHQQQLIHRDIKPENYIRVGDNFKLIEFGLIHGFEDKILQSQLIFYAPELIESRNNCTDKVDVWALACSFYEILSSNQLIDGSTPYEVINQIKRHKNDPNFINRKINQLPTQIEIKQLLIKMLNYNDQQRLSIEQVYIEFCNYLNKNKNNFIEKSDDIKKENLNQSQIIKIIEEQQQQIMEKLEKNYKEINQKQIDLQQNQINSIKLQLQEKNKTIESLNSQQTEQKLELKLLKQNQQVLQQQLQQQMKNEAQQNRLQTDNQQINLQLKNFQEQYSKLEIQTKNQLQEIIKQIQLLTLQIHQNQKFNEESIEIRSLEIKINKMEDQIKSFEPQFQIKNKVDQYNDNNRNQLINEVQNQGYQMNSTVNEEQLQTDQNRIGNQRYNLANQNKVNEILQTQNENYQNKNDEQKDISIKKYKQEKQLTLKLFNIFNQYIAQELQNFMRKQNCLDQQLYLQNNNSLENIQIDLFNNQYQDQLQQLSQFSKELNQDYQKTNEQTLQEILSQFFSQSNEVTQHFNKLDQDTINEYQNLFQNLRNQLFIQIAPQMQENQYLKMQQSFTENCKNLIVDLKLQNQKQINESNNLVEDLQKEIQNLQNLNQNIINESNKQVDTLKKEIENLQTQTQNQNQVNQSKIEINNLKKENLTQINQSKIEIDNLKKENQNLQNQLSTQVKDIENLNKQKQDLIAQISQQVQMMSTKMKECLNKTNEIMTLKQTISNLEKKISDMQEQMKEMC